ncbi:MAG TPA: hypothetical protein DD670_07180 [Planctomycetaceae bacterium]|nr:hypothetical protein [Planctomycetaceae bacterium]
MKHHLLGAILLAVGMVIGGMLGFHGPSVSAAQKQNIPPFADSAGRSLNIINELKELVALTKTQNDLLREQNQLFKSGKLRVVVTVEEKGGRSSSSSR